eukprot:m.332359 g.332359  ORF g.332359 m.332359 type:complete len:167 (+) comp16937_c0_seq1:111-611(+)
MPSKKLFKKDEHELINQYIQEKSGGSFSALYSGMGLIPAALPIYLYVFILHVDLGSNLILFAIVSIASGLVLSQAHKAVALKLRRKIENLEHKKATHASESSRKKIPEIAQKRAASTAIMQNNAVYLCLIVAMVFYFCANMSTIVSYIMSTLGSALLVLLFSSGSD